MTPTDELDQLREENRQLRALLVPPAILAPPEWGLTRREARVYAHLASRDVATREGVMYVIGDGRALEAQNLTVTVYSIRKKLPAGYRIHTIWGVGYRLERPTDV